MVSLLHKAMVHLNCKRELNEGLDGIDYGRCYQEEKRGISLATGWYSEAEELKS
jgi:hypothetical protein